MTIKVSAKEARERLSELLDRATRGEEVRLGPGASVTTRLTEPLTVRVRIGS